MEVVPKVIEYYCTLQNRCPYKEWFDEIRSKSVKQRIDTRLDRVSLGLLGQCNTVGDGVHELKIDTGPGYRIYFGNDGTKVIVLLTGGDKSTQSHDIQMAHLYWADYLRRNPI